MFRETEKASGKAELLNAAYRQKRPAEKPLVRLKRYQAA